MSLGAFEFLFFDSVREASNDFVVPKTFSKIKKIPGIYMHTDISRTAMIFEAKIPLHEVTKSINSQTNNKSSWPSSKIINTSQLNYPLCF